MRDKVFTVGVAEAARTSDVKVREKVADVTEDRMTGLTQRQCSVALPTHSKLETDLCDAKHPERGASIRFRVVFNIDLLKRCKRSSDLVASYYLFEKPY